MSKAILLLHGFLTDKKDFDPILPELEKRYDYVANINLPGHGEGGDYKDFTPDATFDFAKKNIEELLQKFDGIDVLGFSMGGAIAVYLASYYRIRKLILLAPANKFLNPSFIHHKINLQIEISNYYRGKSGEDIEEKKKYIEDLKADDKNSMDIAFKRLFPEWTPKNIGNFNKVIKIANSCNSFDVPTLIVWGKLDQLVPRKSIDYVFNKCINENKKIVEYDDISHLMLYSQQRQKIIDAVVDFIDNK